MSLPGVQQENHFAAFIIPDDVHIAAAFKEVCGPLDAFDAQG
jgi:hypothetical protein